MLNIYYGRENLKKDQFLFDFIKGKTLLLVPDQFTLQAERDAFFYLNTKSLADLEVLSFSRLGKKVLAETGGGKKSLIDKYGRHMLLAKILAEQKEELSLYKGLEKKNSFIELANNFISEMKQYGVKPEQLINITAGLEKHSFLCQKLSDIQKLYSSYEAAIGGKYLDTEDYIQIYIDKIPKSQKIRSSTVWVYGFDTFTPKNLQVLGALLQTAKEVNIVLTWSEGCLDEEIFQLTGTLMKKLQHMAEEHRIAWQQSVIPADYVEKEKTKTIILLEQELFAIPTKPSEEQEGITLVKAANFYAEAESAAAQILHLVRDLGLAYKDILLICNDIETRGAIIKRVFAQYGIPLFIDRKRSILHNPASAFILSLLDICANNYRSEDLLRFLKTGLTPLSWDQIESLENYALTYKTRGSQWKKPFTKGEAQYTEIQLTEIEQARGELVQLIDSFTRDFKKAKTVKEKVLALYYFLRDEAKLPQKLEELIKTQEETGYLEAAEETAQVWSIITDILDQFVEVVGDETLLAESFSDILKSGLEAIEIGLLPPTADGLLMGTMQRTRTSHVKAMLILGANEGILPADAPSETLLSEEEKIHLKQNGIELCKLDEIRLQEEKLAIYRNLSKPEQQLWISYAASDSEGKEMKPSPIFETITSLFPKVQVKKDLLSEEEPMALIQAAESTAQHMTKALRRTIDGQELSLEWKETTRWYQNTPTLERIKQGLFFTNKQQDLEQSLTGQIFQREKTERLSADQPQTEVLPLSPSQTDALPLSPSRLERYSRCPFSHFISYGLRPREIRPFEMGGREIGDLYHFCLMELSRVLTREGKPINDPKSPWMIVTREDCAAYIADILKEQAGKYMEGLLTQSKEETYRMSRLQDICLDMAWILIDHVRRGSIHTIAFEEAFGRGRAIPPIEVETPQGTVQIEGKIDRMDILADGRVKIIDYKTGRESFSAQEARKGYKLQLFLYLKAAQGQKREKTAPSREREPAGVFYFLINEPSVDASQIPQAELANQIASSTQKAYKLDGVLVNKESVIQNIAGEFTGYSHIASIKSTASGISGSGKDRLLDEKEFQGLQQAVDEKVKELCSALLSGDIRIQPKRTKDTSACTYCTYKGICQFDLAFEGCRYEVV